VNNIQRREKIYTEPDDISYSLLKDVSLLHENTTHTFQPLNKDKNSMRFELVAENYMRNVLGRLGRFRTVDAILPEEYYSDLKGADELTYDNVEVIEENSYNANHWTTNFCFKKNDQSAFHFCDAANNLQNGGTNSYTTNRATQILSSAQQDNQNYLTTNSVAANISSEDSPSTSETSDDVHHVRRLDKNGSLTTESKKPDYFAMVATIPDRLELVLERTRHSDILLEDDDKSNYKEIYGTDFYDEANNVPANARGLFPFCKLDTIQHDLLEFVLMAMEMK
jgi:hypothetical protein